MSKPGLYKKLPFSRGVGEGVTLPGLGNKRIIAAKHNLPRSVILVHGVNDVGVSYDALESGLCEGLTKRLCGDLRPATYRMPQTSDRDKVEDDPDAVFYKRTPTDDAYSPVIPFYSGYREEQGKHATEQGLPTASPSTATATGWTRTIPRAAAPSPTRQTHCWTCGTGARGPIKAIDAASRDATHPILKNPGRLYMVLAARRLAALISMIRDYDEDETVSIVAHSQGTMVSLLTQAFLLDPKMQDV